MNEEELKAGERYNFTLLYTGQSINNKFRFESPTGIHYILGLGDMEAVSPVPAPKHDPCRLFKKGDKVRVVEWNGRKLNYGADIPDIIEIEDDERPGAIDVSVFWKGYSVWGKAHIPQCYLELVTPVEEIQQFFLESDNNLYFCIYFGTSQNYELVSRLRKKYYSLTDAEAECTRLNAAFRKEREND